MGKLRDIGAALSMGLSATTRQKEAERKFSERVGEHQRNIQSFNIAHERSIDCFAELATRWEQAKETLLKCGVVTKDPWGNLSKGWFGVPEREEAPDGSNLTGAAVGSIPSVAAFIGAPVAAWTIISTVGTAGTGTAIGTLTGVAATTATAAWLGRLGVAGATGLGVRAAPLALGGIGLLATIPVQGIVGAFIAGRNERKKVEEVENGVKEMEEVDTKLKKYISELSDLESQAKQETESLIWKSAVLETLMEKIEKELHEAGKAAESLIEEMENAKATCRRFVELQSEMHKDLTSSTPE